MPKGMGYGNRPNHPRHDQMRGNPTSYRDSPAKTPATGDKTNRHGFSRNPKQNSSFRQGDKNPFPTPHDSVGPWTGPKGKMSGSYHGSHGPSSGMRSKSHKGY